MENVLTGSRGISYLVAVSNGSCRFICDSDSKLCFIDSYCFTISATLALGADASEPLLGTGAEFTGPGLELLTD